MSVRLLEEDVTRNAQLKDIAKFMKNVLLETPLPKFEKRDRITTTTTPPSVPVNMRVVESSPSTSETVYESTLRKPKFELKLTRMIRRRMTMA